MNIGINRKSIIIPFLMLLTSNAFADGSVSLLYGQKSLNKSDWDPIQSQTTYGIGLEYKEPGSTYSFVLSYLTGDDSTTASIYDPTYGNLSAKIKGGTTELDAGARAYMTPNNPRIYVEGGIASISANVHVSLSGYGSASDSASSIGLWLGVGVDVSMTREWSVGVLGRYSDASADLIGVNVKTGGTHLDVYGAYHF